jgi:hypothetical protein
MIPFRELKMTDDEDDILDDEIQPDEDDDLDAEHPEPAEGAKSESHLEETIDEDNDFARTIESLFESDSAAAKRLARRIDISGYEDAFYADEHGTLIPKFEVGDRIIIERNYSARAGYDWYITAAFTVKKLNYVTGDLTLWNDERGQWDLSNWISGIHQHGVVYKLPASYGNPFRKRGRGRPPSNKPKPPVETGTNPEVKRKRGRPPGSKNRASEKS